tara:strand:+ start:125 stop:364 length:240 start_codon:yes stop_codon:yes gene_type:complete
MDRKNKDLAFTFERGFHYVFIVFMVVLTVFCAWFVYVSVQKPVTPEAPIYENENKAAAKPLPDFIVDKVKPDELETLKP